MEEERSQRKKSWIKSTENRGICGSFEEYGGGEKS